MSVRSLFAAAAAVGTKARRGLPALPGLVIVAAGLLAGCAQQPTSPSASGEGLSQVSRPSALPDSVEESETRRRARIRTELGAGYYQQRNFPVALGELRQALAIDPTYAAAYGMQGLVYMDLGERDKADESFAQAMRLAPNDPDLNNNYGWYLCQTDRIGPALERFTIALRDPLYRTPALALRNAGLCTLKQGDEAGAESLFLRALQADPRDPVAQFQLAELYLKRRNIERARQYQQGLMSMYELSPQVLWLALRIERQAGNREVEASYGAQLRRRFPQSRETALLLSGQYDN
ncbi:MAG: type IV pilus biogenesis/stability protein PilW [Burkholderiaceae bacterium]